MGRRKISIQPITDERNRKVTFVKRKAGLFKKAHELAVLCQVDLAVIIMGNNNNKFYEYTSVNPDELLVAYKDDRYSHDVKTPADYGEYIMESRVKKFTPVGSHHRTASSVSFSVDENDNENSSEEDDDDDDDDDDEKQNSSKPPSKRRRTTAMRQRIKLENSSAPEQQVVPPTAPYVVAQPGYQTHMTSQGPIPEAQGWGQPPHNANMETVPATHPHPPYIQFQMSAVPQPYHYPVAGNFAASPIQHRAQEQPVSQSPAHSRQPSQPLAQHLPAMGTPLIQSAQTLQSSPFMNSRARTLNNSISTRPILRVEIPTDPTRPVHSSKPGDSAITLSALDANKNDPATRSTDAKPSGGDKTPPSAISDIRPSGLGILSNNSTPVSATLPSALFNLPPPQPSAHFHHHGNNGNLKQLAAGEQTPLTAGLPSRYVPDLFPSPSNFYSNDWNIPFGSGNTPYPSSAGPHMLPLPNSNPNPNVKVRKHTMLSNDPVDSPLQNLQKENKDDAKSAAAETLESKRINFRKPKVKNHGREGNGAEDDP